MKTGILAPGFEDCGREQGQQGEKLSLPPHRTHRLFHVTVSVPFSDERAVVTSITLLPFTTIPSFVPTTTLERKDVALNIPTSEKSVPLHGVQVGKWRRLEVCRRLCIICCGQVFLSWGRCLLRGLSVDSGPSVASLLCLD